MAAITQIRHAHSEGCAYYLNSGIFGHLLRAASSVGCA
jgi:hypothetical protein